MQLLRTLFRWLVIIFVTSSIVMPLTLRYFPVPITAFMLYRHAEDLFSENSFKKIDYRWVNRDAISANIKLAVIASEDQRFFQHNGFDFRAIQASIEDYQEGGQLRGASTISQQVAKNIFLMPVKSFIRKGLEVWFTILLEVFLPKQRILEIYLNIAELGDHIFGVEAASQNYSGLSAKQLNPAQAALLAATLPNPFRLKAQNPSRYVFKRKLWILKQMHNLKNSRFIHE